MNSIVNIPFIREGQHCCHFYKLVKQSYRWYVNQSNRNNLLPKKKKKVSHNHEPILTIKRKREAGLLFL
ncbi:hypothetical protein EUGRSUZ_E04283 [Eucalyptus grandis]|uniref:Uncharacterized protein n=2 Tax=Eucalyptus grandis TaxID=71139 RepID=A0ACC3L262_EUCGR|nr:hypothetical protein EUGRSUZ_E04283 [Eucalyptus grandis]